MYLYNIKLWNFRKYGLDDKIDLDKPNLNLDLKKGLNLFIGENDSGKSAIMDAIKIVLKTTSYEWIRITHNDFYKDTNRLRIALKFRDFEVEEAKNFVEFLSWEVIDKRKEPVLNLIYDISRKDDKIIPSDVKAGSDSTGKRVPAEVKELLKVTYLKPLRDAQTELIPKQNSRISQIFKEHEAFKNSENHILLKSFQEFNKSIELYFDGKDKEGKSLDGAQEGRKLKQSIDSSIKKFFDEKSESTINTTQAEIKKILESLELSLLGVYNPGLGSLNRLFMASELVHLNKNNWTGVRLALIEEIEAHLHPQVQLKVIESLKQQKDTQLLVTTHSPNLASKVNLEQIVICKNNNAYPLSHEYTNLDKKNYVFLEKFLDVTKSNLFFARGIILVEGWAEEILLPVIARKFGYDFTRFEVSVINVGNLGFSHYYKIFSRKDNEDMKIPIAVLTDCDIRAYSEKIKENNKFYVKEESKKYYGCCKNKIKEIKNKYQLPAHAFVSNEWTFEWCLYKSHAFKDVFIETVKEVHSKTDWDDFEVKLAEKLIQSTLNKSEIAYRMANKLEDDKYVIEDNKFIADDSIKYIVEAIEHVCR